MRPTSQNFTLLLVGLLLASVFHGSVLTAATIKEEYSVKVALIYNFVRFTQWPQEVFSEDPGTIRIMVYGDDNLRPVFSSIDGAQVGERRIKVVFAEKPEDVLGCHLLFLAKTERENWSQIMAALGPRPVLTVGEMNGFLESGGIMNLHLDNKKVRFQANLDQARKNNLVISSRILKFASSVVCEEGETE